MQTVSHDFEPYRLENKTTTFLIVYKRLQAANKSATFLKQTIKGIATR